MSFFVCRPSRGVPARLTPAKVTVAAGRPAWFGVRRCPRPGRLVPQLIASGLSLSGLGDVLCVLAARSGESPDISIADGAYLASYLSLGGALVVSALVRSRPWPRSNGVGSPPF